MGLLVEERSWDSGDLVLRDYQVECLNAIEEGFKKYDRILINIPTGGGKTVIFNTYIKTKNLRALVIAHREELVEQAIEKFLMIGGDPDSVGRIKRGVWDVKKYTSASIQTLIRNIDRIDGSLFDIVVIDEAHHYVADVFRKALEKLIETNKNIKFLGVTATPFRSDEKDLKEFFEEQVYSIGILDLIEKDNLVPLEGRVIPLPIDEDELELAKYNDENVFKRASLRKVFNTEKVNEAIYNAWEEYALGKKTIFYTSSVEHAKSLAEYFQRQGVISACVEGRMSSNQRRATLELFRSGEIKVLTNMNILTEGFDDPSVEVIGLVRPTSSLVLYTQIIGRGLRVCEGKEKCIVLDFVGAMKKYRDKIVSIPEMFGMAKEIADKIAESREALYVGRTRSGLKVLVGNKEPEFVLLGKELEQFLTKIGDTYLVTCGFNDKVLVAEKEKRGTYKISLYEKWEKGVVLAKSITEDYLFGTLATFWKEHKDEKISELLEKMKSRKPTAKQMKYIVQAKEAGILPEDFDVETSLDASNTLGYLFFVRKFFGYDFECKVHCPAKLNWKNAEFFTVDIYDKQGEVMHLNGKIFLLLVALNIRFLDRDTKSLYTSSFLGKWLRVARDVVLHNPERLIRGINMDSKLGRKLALLVNEKLRKYYL